MFSVSVRRNPERKYCTIGFLFDVWPLYTSPAKKRRGGERTVSLSDRMKAHFETKLAPASVALLFVSPSTGAQI